MIEAYIMKNKLRKQIEHVKYIETSTVDCKKRRKQSFPKNQCIFGEGQ